MINVIKIWFYYHFKEKRYIKNVVKFDAYYICKTISENDFLKDDTKCDVLDFYGLQYNK